jgi:putative flavoprotein involved in K+ transport
MRQGRACSYGGSIDSEKGAEMAASEQYDTIVIGGGQAGLAAGYFLKQAGRSFAILDDNERVGDAWRQRWDSLRLYSPAMRDGLPGMPFPASPTSYPTAAEMGAYLEAYATGLELPVHSGVRIDSLAKEDGRYVASGGDRRFEADNAVVATGVFRRPYIPSFADELDPSITQLHSNDYRNLSQLADGPVLVVGASHSGSDLAYEASAEHEVILSGKDTGQIPAPIESRRGRTFFRGLFLVGTHVLTVDTPLGRKMRPHVRHGGGPLLRYRRKDLRKAGVERVLARTVGVEGGRPVLDDGRVLDVANVIWCTGFRPDYSWIRLPFERGDDGYPVQYRGVVASSPGLYFVGLPFLHSFASMFIGGAGRDAERVVRHIVDERAAQEAAAAKRLPMVAAGRTVS